MSLRRLFIPILFLSGLLLSACALGEMIQQTNPGPTPTLEAALPASGTAEPTLPAETLPPAPTAIQKAPQLVLVSGNLPSYTTRLIITFSGKDAQGNSTSSQLEVTEEVDKAHNASHRLARTEVHGQPPGSLDLYQSEKGVFLISTEIAGCVKTAPQNTTRPGDRPPQPTDLVQSLGRGTLIGKGEKINGATTDHYNLAEARVSFGSIEKLAGDIWIDNQSGLVLRQNGRAEGAFSLGGSAAYGRVDWQYDLTQAANVQIDLPADCQTLENTDLPYPPNAGDPTQSGEELSFLVQTKPALVSDFYRTELLKGGWTIETDSGGGSIFELDATKANHSLKITITAQAQGALVIILRK